MWLEMEQLRFKETKKGDEIKVRQWVHTHLNRRRDLTGSLERISTITCSGKQDLLGFRVRDIFQSAVWVERASVCLEGRGQSQVPIKIHIL